MKHRIQTLESVIIEEIISLAKFHDENAYEINLETCDSVKSDIKRLKRRLRYFLQMLRDIMPGR